ncbi:MAG TPA: FAD synthase [Candidatus Syntrophoarchaeum butanivorans]|uniref:FAD synthase n=1 Tax=Candidatus Syntropharchaeum butanivorans TaxID=1839936 RepID=A0A1F2P642_9EURY|nr:MAG: FAD synthase [Candidatus Syntrophoarchaeum butanivorans]RJS71067.1 MAG: FAD synthase [Candidatus Syntrophoarchaeum sp. WYZ-LMO15]HDM35782.1 FAD synthase [Candidatus Syntrophoarchaeum butanivorans]HEC57670.1 FAD synthase [Candidatus Syntrophoarchaeum butanivorans]
MVRVLATGTFDILHPGHLLYLTEAKKLGDELYVIVARDANVVHKPKPILPEKQRVEMVGSLKVVDKAILGDPKDKFRLVEEIKPDIIALGYDQHFRVRELEEELRARGIDAKVVRIEASNPCPLCSSRAIIERILKVKGGER